MKGNNTIRLFSVAVIFLMLFSGFSAVINLTSSSSEMKKLKLTDTVKRLGVRGQEVESEGNDLSGTADEFNAGTPGDPLLVNGSLSAEADVDWFKITVGGSDPGIINVSLTAPFNVSVNPDYEFTVYEANDDTASKQYVYGSDQGQNNNLATMKTCWAAGPGFYYVRVKVTQGTTVVTPDDYQFNFTFTADGDMLVESEILDKNQPNDEAIDATPMNLTGTELKEVEFFGTVRSDTDHDWYLINLSAPTGGRVNIQFETFYKDITGTHNGHTYDLKLYGPQPSGTNAEDIMLSGEDSGAAGATLISGSMLPPGNYLMEVFDETLTSYSAFEPYRIYLNFTPEMYADPNVQLESELEEPVEQNDLMDSATTVQLSNVGGGVYNGTAKGTLDSETDQDWYNISLPGAVLGELEFFFDTPNTLAVNPTYWYTIFRTDRPASDFLNVSNQGTAGEYTETLLAVRPALYYIRVMGVGVGNPVIRAEAYRLHFSFTPGNNLPTEEEHAGIGDNNEPDLSENITMLEPGDGRAYHLGEMYGTIEHQGDRDYYTFSFDDSYVGTLDIYVTTPNFVQGIYYHYEVYGPDSTYYKCGDKYNYGSTGQEMFTIPGGIPGEYIIMVESGLGYDMAHPYYLRIEFLPQDTTTFLVAGTIGGTVLNNFTSNPISNVPIQIWNEGQTEQWGAFLSDDSGDYMTSGMPKQTIWIQVNHNGYAPFSTMITMEEGQNKDLDIMLTPTYGSLNGYVYDDQSHIVRNANVDIVGTGLSTRSNNDGYYEFANIPTGMYTVRFSLEDYIPFSTQAIIQESQASQVHGYINRKTGGILVALKDEDNNTITESATLTLIRQNMDNQSITLGNWNGYYTYGLSPILIGNYTLIITHQDYATMSIGVRIYADQWVWKNLTLTNKRFIVLMYDNATGNPFTSSGQFYVKLYSLNKLSIDPEDTTALSNALVDSATQLYDNYYEFYTGAYGYYWRFYNIENGDYILNITHINWEVGNPYGTYLPYEVRVTVSDADLIINVSMTKPGFKLLLIEGGTNNSVSDATVQLKYNLEQNTNYYIYYDSGNGWYLLEQQLNYGSYTLTVTHGDYKGVIKTFNINKAYTFMTIDMYPGILEMEIDGGDEIYMHQENRVIVTVTDNETSEKLSGVTITVSTGTYGSYATDGNGRVEITVQPTNDQITIIVFTATYSGYTTVTKQFDIIVGEEPTKGRISGTVSGTSSLNNLVVDLYLGVPNLVIVSRSEPIFRESTTTDDSGYFMFSDLPFDWYTLCIGKGQDLRCDDSWKSNYNSIQLELATGRFKDGNTLYVSQNNPAYFKERTKEGVKADTNPDAYNDKVYPEYEYNPNRGDVFRIYVADGDKDEPEYVKLRIGGKEFEMTALEKTNEEYYGDNIDFVLPSLYDGRYYEVVVKDLKSGDYNYTFATKDMWSSQETIKAGSEKVEITSVSDILEEDKMTILIVFAVLCVILFILVLVFKSKAKKHLYSKTNKELTVYGVGYTLQSLDTEMSSDIVGDINDLRKKYLEGNLSTEEFIRRMK